MVSCFKCGLSKGKRTKEERISFHRFPSNNDQKQKWINFVGKVEEPKQFATLCSNHFEASCFDHDAFAFIKLKPDAVPTVEVIRFKHGHNENWTNQPKVNEEGVEPLSFEEINEIGNEVVEVENVYMTGVENVMEMNLIEEVEEIKEMEEEMGKNETETDVEKKKKKENEIFRKIIKKDKQETNKIKPLGIVDNTKKCKNVSSKLVDLFQQSFVMDHLLKYTEQKISYLNMDFSTQTGNENDTIVSPRCVCRLCTKADKTIYMKLFHGDKTMTPIANKIAYLMGEHKIEQDLLPQQICLGCSEMVDSSYNALRQFSESHQILTNVVAEFRNKTHLIYHNKRDKKVAQYLKISDKDYEFSSNSQTTFGFEGRARIGQSSTNNSSSVKCFVCMENFASGDLLKAHTCEVHGCKIEYKCTSCNITFPTFTDLRAHMNISTVCTVKHKDTKLEHEIKNNQNVDLPLSENENNDLSVNEDDIIDDRRKSENNDRSSEIDFDDDIIIPNDDSTDPKIRNVLIKRRKKRILSQYYFQISKKGPVESRSCNYCDNIFKSIHSDEHIKAHVLTHLSCLSDTKESNDINILDIGQHTSTISSYVCSVCKIARRTPAELKAHLSRNCSMLRKKYNLKSRRGGNTAFLKRKSIMYYCKTCNDDTPYKNKDFKFHIKENHPELEQKKIKTVSKFQNILHNCKTCNSDTLYTLSELKIHTKENHPELVVNCPYCQSCFIKKCKLRTHIKAVHLKSKEASATSVTDEDKVPLLCEFCSLECKSKQGYLNHVKKTHLNPNTKPKKQKTLRQRFQLRERIQKKLRNSSGDQYYCHVCNKTLQFKEGSAGLEFHIRRHNYPDNKIECCNRKYEVYIKYQTHLRSHSRNWPCKVCGVLFPSMVQLQDHLTQRHKRCEDCGHIAKTFKLYMKHKDKHKKSLEDKFSCFICNLQFDTKHGLWAHRNQFHWEECCKPKEVRDLPEPIACCGKKFLRQDNLKRHTAKHRDTPCKKCGDVLESKLALLSHNAVHHTQGRECPYCCKMYTNSDGLKYHMLKHTHGRQFKCLCGLAFYTESDMRKHQKNRKTPCIGKTMLQGRQSDVETEEVIEWNMEL
ncbi:hypothetical protein WDU94_014673 [Cyamophila willieti]